MNRIKELRKEKKSISKRDSGFSRYKRKNNFSVGKQRKHN
ncbi:Uncharacterised protein [Streptococcus pyogenes]|nr:Uncharacterised protein [Streptococcus pyogenes]VGU62921.1 Uncharacterised protein [Streptococcus pyogenes]VGV11894.1 Uncharacterised protein [Streptococcus pyogenes]VGW03488.1 Uncharacterised protein [Streptococcus pyogenes]VGW22605.1 Uncharacterised protein [Streptococcus pyogenes]